MFIETVAKLRPKYMIMENVEGLLLGEAWKYVQEIYRQLKAAGYRTKHWLCKGENMGVPQTRHRVFFVAVRDDVEFDLQYLDMTFNYEPVPYGEIKQGVGRILNPNSKYYSLLGKAQPGDKDLADIKRRIGEKESGFSDVLARDSEVLPTIKANLSIYVAETRSVISIQDIIHAQTFPEDYDFVKHTENNAGYICGMSVPPVMIKRIVQRLIDAGAFSYKEAGDK